MHCNFRQTGSRSDDSVFVIITAYRTLLCLDVCACQRLCEQGFLRGAMITCYGLELYTHLVCVWHRGMQQGTAVFTTPCWGMGTPMAWRQTPSVPLMLLPLLLILQVWLKILKLCPSCLLLLLQLQPMLRSSETSPQRRNLCLMCPNVSLIRVSV